MLLVSWLKEQFLKIVVVSNGKFEEAVTNVTLHRGKLLWNRVGARCKSLDLARKCTSTAGNGLVEKEVCAEGSFIS